MDSMDRHPRWKLAWVAWNSCFEVTNCEQKARIVESWWIWNLDLVSHVEAWSRKASDGADLSSFQDQKDIKFRGEGRSSEFDPEVVRVIWSRAIKVQRNFADCKLRGIPLIWKQKSWRTRARLRRGHSIFLMGEEVYVHQCRCKLGLRSEQCKQDKRSQLFESKHWILPVTLR